MGRRYTEPPPFDLPACYDDSENTTPLVFILSTGSDPNKDIQELARNLGMEDKWTSIAFGQGQSKERGDHDSPHAQQRQHQPSPQCRIKIAA